MLPILMHIIMLIYLYVGAIIYSFSIFGYISINNFLCYKMSKSQVMKIESEKSRHIWMFLKIALLSSLFGCKSLSNVTFLNHFVDSTEL